MVQITAACLASKHKDLNSKPITAKRIIKISFREVLETYKGKLIEI
jgi:hypothetical protein